MSQVKKSPFGKTDDGGEVFVFTLEDEDGAYTEVLNYGAIWKTTLIPDAVGNLVDICLSYNTLKGYIDDKYYIGATVGRFANRIKGAEFSLGGKTYSLQKNNGDNSLHGGFDAYNKRLWDYEISDGSVAFTLHSPDGDQGYPGNLDITVTYTFKDSTLAIDYLAVCDEATPVNLTNHAYFNLAGAGAGETCALGQFLRINAEQITEMDEELLTTGQFLPVDNKPFDLRKGAVINDLINAGSWQMQIGKGFDLNYVVDGEGLREAAALTCPASGLSMKLLITNPGLQFYSGNVLSSPFPWRGAICLEPQHYPDSVHHPHFPSSILKAKDRYVQRTEYQFKRCP